jgi:hypothetical protein
MCISGQTTVNTPSIKRLTVKNVFAARRPTIVDRSWVKEIKSEDMFLTYLHIHRPPSSIAMGIGLHCSHRVEIWVILKISGRIRKLSNSSSGANNSHKN